MNDYNHFTHGDWQNKSSFLALLVFIIFNDLKKQIILLHAIPLKCLNFGAGPYHVSIWIYNFSLVRLFLKTFKVTFMFEGNSYKFICVNKSTDQVFVH